MMDATSVDYAECDIWDTLFQEADLTKLAPVEYHQIVNIMPEKKAKKSTTCPNCDIEFSIDGNQIYCTECGLEFSKDCCDSADLFSANLVNDFVTDTYKPMQLKIIGRNSYGQNRGLMRSSSNYSAYRATVTFKALCLKNMNNESGKQIPKNVLEEANAMFSEIKQHEDKYVFRKYIKDGVLSACIYYACYRNNITKTPNEIAQMMKIPEKFHSMGDRILRDLCEKSIIEIPAIVNPISDYITRYMQIVNIPSNYFGFIADIIDTASSQKLHVFYDSKNNTKCIGAIYLLVTQEPTLHHLIDKIDTICEISRTTFIKYYQMICIYYRKFVHVFVKHAVAMKAEWKADIMDYINSGGKSVPVPIKIKVMKTGIVQKKAAKKSAPAREVGEVGEVYEGKIIGSTNAVSKGANAKVAKDATTVTQQLPSSSTNLVKVKPKTMKVLRPKCAVDPPVRSNVVAKVAKVAKQRSALSIVVSSSARDSALQVTKKKSKKFIVPAGSIDKLLGTA